MKKEINLLDCTFNGDVLMCPHDWGKKLIVGNLKKESFIDILTGFCVLSKNRGTFSVAKSKSHPVNTDLPILNNGLLSFPANGFPST